MRVTFWGTRGSIAKAGPSTLRFGGNTSCVEIRSQQGTLVVVDCGTGAHGLGVDLMARSGGEPVDGHLLISHTHWDHIQGLPFFAPLFDARNTWHIYGPRGLGGSMIETLAGQMQYSYFPITLEQLAARVRYHDLVEGSFVIGDLVVTAEYLNHPALTLGYRIEGDGAVVVYASDHEPHQPELAAGGDLASNRHDGAFVDFLDGADLVIHDAQYLASEYAAKQGWGHSTVEYAVDAANQAGAARLALFHHDPLRDDTAVDALVERARRHAAASGYGGEVFAAAEGLGIELEGDRSPAAAATDTNRVATRRPIAGETRGAVLIAVERPDLRNVVDQAAEVEDLAISHAADPNDVVARAGAEHPQIVVLEDRGDALERAHAIRATDDAYGDTVSIIVVSQGSGDRPTDTHPLTEWLRWPFSGVYMRTKLRTAVLKRACRWKIAPLPPDEDRRLAALRRLNVLDTPPEPRFDRLTRRASELLDVPVALVSLIDSDRQWFKSSHGFAATETPRDAAFCAHAILDDSVLQVPDALRDERFADNPAVVGEPRVRFYAGAPLRLSDGSAVGTLCIVDYRPRLLSSEQLADLKDLARQVVRELEGS